MALPLLTGKRNPRDSFGQQKTAFSVLFALLALSLFLLFTFLFFWFVGINAPRGSEYYFPGSENDRLSSERVLFSRSLGPEKGTERAGRGQRASLGRELIGGRERRREGGEKNSLSIAFVEFFFPLLVQPIFTPPRQASCRPRA